MEDDDLASLDGEGCTPLRALTYDRPPPQPSHASPHAFVCADGHTYWVKRSAQDGLIAELLAGRLGGPLGAAPAAEVVEVVESALDKARAAAHLLGIGAGSADQPGMENFRHITQRTADGKLDLANLDAASVARVVVFQTWLGAGDTQILVDLRTGKLVSVDHGSLQAVSAPGSDPTLVVAEGIPEHIGRDHPLIDAIVTKIEAFTDEAVLRALAQMPDGPEWQANCDRRLEIAKSIALRRDRLREAMTAWSK